MGDDIYGGWIDAIKYDYLYWEVSENSSHSVASDPVRICICINLVPLCNVTKYENVIEVFPGEVFKLNVVAVGQRMGIVPAAVIAEISDGGGSLAKGQDVQSVVSIVQCWNTECTQERNS